MGEINAYQDTKNQKNEKPSFHLKGALNQKGLTASFVESLIEQTGQVS